MPKLAQLQAFNARIFRIKASYGNCFDLCKKITDERGWYNRNIAYDPNILDGEKTVAFEISEQLKAHMINLCSGGGYLHNRWRLEGLQRDEKLWNYRRARGDSGRGYVILSRTFDQGRKEPCECTPETGAEGISVSMPRNGFMALRDVRGSKGHFTRVSDKEMLNICSLPLRFVKLSQISLALFFPQPPPGAIILIDHSVKTVLKR